MWLTEVFIATAPSATYKPRMSFFVAMLGTWRQFVVSVLVNMCMQVMLWTTAQHRIVLLWPDKVSLPAQIHWFSIFNSFMMVIFLTGLVSMILMRTLRADYARYTAKEDDDLEALERDVGEESG